MPKRNGSRVVLARLDDCGRRALEEIDAALNRIENGTYGICENCGRRILLPRLQALPAARLYVKCAGTNPIKVPAPFEELPRSGKLPADINLLFDRGLELAVLKQVKEDGRDPTEWPS
ncbi:MAG: TraR/DksA C4-type zinc finger protein [Candidatus Binatia bacterium]|nr:TraR/DksA C4-type zinc finger protein [Candidatus Binatia bacterium]